MPSDVLITPASSKIDFTDGSNATKRLNISGTAFSFNSNLNVLSSTSLGSAFKAEGVNGTLFEVTDDLSNSLMSVNTIGGLPVFEVFANNSIIAGQYNANDFVISGNKVGIGTASPTGKLTVFQGNNPGITLFSNNGAQYAYLQIGRTSSELEIGVVSGSNQFFTGTVTGDAVIKQNSTGKLHLGYASAAPAITIDSSNNVGVGTVSPAYKLQVSGSSGNQAKIGDIIFGSTTAGSNNITAATSFGSNGNLNINASGQTDQIWLISSSGNVGIGTASATSKLTLVQSSGADSVLLELQSNNDPGIRFGRSTYGSLIRHVSATTDYIAFNCSGTSQPAVSATAQIVFDENGNVGVGTLTPLNKIHIAGSASVGSSYNVAAPTNGLIVQGDVGVGTSSLVYSNANRGVIEVYGTTDSLIALRGSTTNSYLQKSGNDFYLVNGGAGVIAINTNGSERWRITSAGVLQSNGAQTVQTSTGNLTLASAAGNGNIFLLPNGTGSVGVGTNSPTQFLDVRGNIKLGADGAGSYIYYVKDNEGTIINTSRSDVTQQGLFRSDGWGNFTVDKSIGIGYSLGSGFSSSTIGNGNLYVLNTIGINTTSPLTKLDVRSGSITSGTANSTSGSTIIAGYYTSGALTVLGTEQASGGPVLGYAVTPSTSATGAFLSSTTIAIGRSAYTQDGGTHRWYIGASQTVAIGSAVTTSEVMRINSNGNVGIGTTTVPSPLAIYNNTDVWHFRFGGASGELRMGGQTNSGAVIQAYTPGGSVRDLYIQRDGGNIGVGLNNPSGKIHIYENANRVSYLAQNNVHTARFEAYGTATAIDTTASNGIFFRMSGADVVKFAVDGNVGINTTSPSYKLDVNGTTRFGGIVYNEAVQTDDFNYFNLQPYIESETLSTILSVSGTAPSFVTLTNTTAPFSKVMSVSAYGEALMSDYIPVQAGETIYGEIWTYRATGAAGTAGVIYCGVQRYDKDKKMIDGNGGLNTSPSGYFIASNQTIPSNSTWTKYSGTLVLPTSHTPYNTSDGGPVRYIRPYIIYNYTAGTILTYIGGWKIRKVQLTRDLGPVSINGNVGIGSDISSYSRLLLSTTSTTPTLDSTNPVDVSLIISNSDVAYGTMFATYGDGKGALQQRRTNAATYYDFNLQPHGGNVGIGTLSPTQKLDVVGSYGVAGDSSGILKIRGGLTSATQINFGISADGGYGWIQATDVGATNNININLNPIGGNVGIGNIAPNNKLAISGSASIGSNYNTTAPTNGLIVEGSVGIGNTNPTGKLQVTGDIRTLQNGSDSVGSQLYIANAANNRAYNFQLNSAGTNLALWGYNSSNAWQNLVNFNYNGNVGIGITSPSATLHVNSTTSGATLLRADGTNGTLFSVVDDLSDSLMSVNNSAGLPVLEVFADDRVVAGQYGANDFVLVNNKLGLGTNNPQYKLDVVGSGTNAAVNIITRISSTASSNTFDTASVIAFTNTTTNVNAYSYIGSRIDLGGAGDNAQSLIFATNATNTLPTEKMRIKSDGNVGIGTASPIAKLDIASTQSNGIIMRFDTTTNYQAWIRPYWNSSTDSRIDFAINRTSGATPDVIMSVGYGSNVGVGTVTPSAKLHVVGPSILANNSAINPDSYLGSVVAGNVADGSGWGVTGGIAGNGNANGRTWAMGSSGNFFYMGFQNGATGGSLQTFLQVSGPNRDLYLVPTSGSVGIGTTAPVTRLQIGSGTTTGATLGIQFGDDTGTRLYRSASGIVTCSGTIAATFSGNLTGNVTGNVTGSSGSCTGNAATASLATTSDRLTTRDNRTISPSSDDAFRLRYGFTSWANDNTSPYADYLHLRSYSDASGGNDNLVMFRKDAIGMRIWQQSFGSATAYSSYKDVAFTDQSFFIGTTSVAINRASAALTLSGVNISGTAASETFGTVTGRGASTSTQITVSTSAGGSMYTGIKSGAGYSDAVSGATFKSITDHPTGGSYAFASYYNGSSGTNSFYVAADGSGYFKSLLTTGSISTGAITSAVIKGDSGSDYPHSFTNTDSGNTHWTNRGGRLLTSNGANWATDGRDPIMALVTSGNTNNANIANSIGLALHNESQNNTFSPAITFSNLSNSGNYNTAYAAIIGRRTGQGVDTNWSAGELHFYTMPVGAYVSNIPSLIIKSDGNVGIGTTAPAATLQVGTGTPTASGNGIQFGDDTTARLYRSSSGVVSVSNSFAAAGGYVYASNYLQTGNNLIYPSSQSATQRLEVGNAANNAWIDGLTIAPGGNVVVAGTLTESSSVRYKENIQTIIAPILPKLEAIRPVTYNKKDNPNNTEYGIIAEELNDLFPEFVNKNDKGEVESVNYSRLTVLLIKAVKELKEEVDRLKNK